MKLALGVLIPVVLLAQPKPGFEVATIKLAAPNAAPKNQLIQTSPTRISIPSMSLTWLIYTAYGDGGYNTAMRVTGGPDWVNNTTYSIEAATTAPSTPKQIRLMLQSLLEERFALKMHTEAPVGDVLSLVVDRPDGKLGPKIRKWDGTCPSTMPALMFPAPRRPLQRVDDKLVVGPASDTDDPSVTYCPSGYRIGGLIIDGATMFTVAEMLSLPAARTLLGTITQDRTGLTGRYTLDLDYLFTGGLPDPASPSLVSAIREQWGLRLVSAKAPLKAIVIESAQRPTEN